MKKLIITLIALICFIPVQAQWKFETVDNGFDSKFKVAYADAVNKKAFVKLFQQSDGRIGFLIYEGFICTDYPTIELTFFVNGEWQAYEPLTGIKSTDNEKVYILNDISSVEADFRKASIMKIRLDDTHCGKQIFEFDMTGSGKALDFMQEP
jgi:hypothetical protein